MFSLRSTWTVLHDLLVFGALVLEPYLHLEADESAGVSESAGVTKLGRDFSFIFLKICLIMQTA